MRSMRWLKWHGVTTSALAFLLVTTTARATVIVDPVGVTATSERGVGDLERGAIHTIDSSGLATPGNLIVGNSHDSGNAYVVWLSMPNVIASTHITWDLGASYSNTLVTGFHLWNYNEGGPYWVRGIKYATILVSDDPTFTAGVTTITAWSSGAGLTAAPSGVPYYGEDYTLPTPAAGRYVRFDDLTNWGDTDQYVGLSEIRFVVVPEPSSVALLGVGGLLLWRQRGGS